MKFVYLSIFLLLLSATTINANTQLFDMLEKESAEDNNSKSNNNKDSPSLFIQTKEKSSSKNKESKSLFEETAKEESKSENKEEKNVQSLFDLESEKEEKLNKSQSTEADKEEETKENEKEEDNEEDSEEEDNDEESQSFAEVSSKKKSKKNKMSRSQRAQLCSNPPSNMSKRKFRRMCGRGSLTAQLTNGNKKRRTKRDRKDEQLSFLEQNINQLHKKIGDLVEDNTALNQKLQNLESFKNHHLDEEDDMMSFIEDQSSKITNIKNTYNKENNALKNQIKTNHEVYDNILDKNSYSINYLGNQIVELQKEFSILRKKVEETRKLAEANSKEPKSLNLEGSLNAHSTSSDKASFGNVHVKGQTFELGYNTQIQIGDSYITSSDLIQNTKFIAMVKEQCGDDFKNCKIITKKEFDQDRQNEAEILKNVRKLRRDSSKLFNEKR